MTTDSVHLAGSVVLCPPSEAPYDDPFSRFGPAKVLYTEGFFVSSPAPTGPSLERYGGAPWPYDHFPPQEA